MYPFFKKQNTDIDMIHGVLDFHFDTGSVTDTHHVKLVERVILS